MLAFGKSPGRVLAFLGSFGFPPARDGTTGTSPSQGVLATKQLRVGAQAGSCCVLSLAGGCWGCVWGVELNLGAEKADGDTHMESSSGRSTPGEGKQNRTRTILCVNDDLICGSRFW